MNILITGANGSLGSELVRQLLCIQKYNIVALVKDEKDTQNLIEFKDRIEILILDISDLTSVLLANNMKMIDVIIHCAALVHQFKNVPSEKYDLINYHATEFIIRTFQHHSTSLKKQFILMSTVAVYGDTKDDYSYIENDLCRPVGAYAKSKLKAEQCLIKYQNTIQWTVFRSATIFGKYDRGNLNRLINFCRKNHFFLIFGSKNNRKSFVYVTDVARAIRLSINNPKAYGETFNITGHPLPVLEILQLIQRKMAIKFFIFRLPALPFQHIKTIKKLTSNNIYDSNKAKKLLGFTALSFEEGLELMCKK